MTAKELNKMALKYLDTVKANRPNSHTHVSSIIFVGREPDGDLPKGNWDTWFEQKKYFVIELGFNNNSKMNIGKQLETTWVMIWKNKTPSDFYFSKKLDSVLNSSVLLNNSN